MCGGTAASCYLASFKEGDEFASPHSEFCSFVPHFLAATRQSIHLRSKNASRWRLVDGSRLTHQRRKDLQILNRHLSQHHKLI
jgi:hypothetical protein